jgi:hypothetical protein
VARATCDEGQHNKAKAMHDEGASRRACGWERRRVVNKRKEKEKKKQTGMHLAFMSRRRARQACVKNRGQLPLAFTSERGVPCTC